MTKAMMSEVSEVAFHDLFSRSESSLKGHGWRARRQYQQTAGHCRGCRVECLLHGCADTSRSTLWSDASTLALSTWSWNVMAFLWQLWFVYEFSNGIQRLRQASFGAALSALGSDCSRGMTDIYSSI